MDNANTNPTDAAMANLESGGNYSAANPNSSARGKYQFMPDTFAGVQKNNPDLPKMTFEQFQQDPAAQEQYQVALRVENETVLKRNGLPQTPANSYFTHQFGAPTGIAMLKADADMGIDKFLSQNIIKNNRLDPNMTVGDLRSFTNQKMDEAMGVQQKPYRIDIYGVGNSEFDGKGLQVAKNPFENIGKDSEKTLAALDESLKSIRQYQEGSPQFNMAVASEFKKDMGPNWSKAFLAGLFGNKQEAYNQITGGAIAPAQMGEAYFDGKLQRVMINSNARGDKWITDASNGKRLPDGTQLTASAPESAIGTTGFIAPQAKAGLLNTKDIQNRSISQIKGYEDTQNVVNSWSSQLPTNGGLIEQIQNRTKMFAPALDNITKTAEGRTLLDVIKAFTGGIVDRKALESAAINYNIPNDKLGDFVTYVRDIGVINKRDLSMSGLHAPGSGTSGELTFEGGSKNVSNWLNSRIHDQAMQSAYNNFFEKEKSNSSSSSELNKMFTKSAEYQAVKNMQKYQQQGRNAVFVDGAPIANFDKNNDLIIQKWNANTKRGE